MKKYIKNIFCKQFCDKVRHREFIAYGQKLVFGTGTELCAVELRYILINRQIEKSYLDQGIQIFAYAIRKTKS